jgi:hypothetical protein
VPSAKNSWRANFSAGFHLLPRAVAMEETYRKQHYKMEFLRTGGFSNDANRKGIFEEKSRKKRPTNLDASRF